MSNAQTFVVDRGVHTALASRRCKEGSRCGTAKPTPPSPITAEILDVSIGSAANPVRGSGVFVGGHGNWDGKSDGGVLSVSTLRTGEIHTNGGIPPGTPDLISGGVFVIFGARVERVVNTGAVTTYGQNDMVLDNWGTVTSWTASAPVTSEGPSGIGFVNFGDIGLFDVKAPLVTHGKGARRRFDITASFDQRPRITVGPGFSGSGEASKSDPLQPVGEQGKRTFMAFANRACQDRIA